MEAENNSVSERKVDSSKKNHRKKGVSVDCVVSEWSEWSSCESSASCGKNGKQTRTRSIVTPSTRGGAKCPKKKELKQRRKCRNEDAAPCAGGEDVGVTGVTGVVDCV